MRDLEPGDPPLVGPYTLRARLGEGGMGRVYLAHSPSGRLTAVKVIRPELAHDTVFRDRFRREVGAARLVSGAFTAPVVDADPDATSPWLATQYVPGPSLHEAVAQAGPFALNVLRRLAAGLLEALIAVHRAGLVHRDLKPSNVLLAADGPRVIDFGIARAADHTELTRSGDIVGTAAYMSPEQANGLEAGPGADVFALGAVLAFAATGRSPFGHGTPAGVLFRVVHGEPDLTGVPPELHNALRSCLAKDPDARPGPETLLGWFADGVRVDGPSWPDGVSALLAERAAEVSARLSTPRPQGRAVSAPGDGSATRVASGFGLPTEPPPAVAPARVPPSGGMTPLQGQPGPVPSARTPPSWPPPAAPPAFTPPAGTPPATPLPWVRPPTGSETVFPGHWRRYLALGVPLLLAGLFLVICLLVAIFDPSGGPGVTLFLTVLFLALSVLTLSASWWRLRYALHRPSLVLGPDGLQARAGDRRVDIAWQQVAHAGIIRLGHHDVLVVQPVVPGTTWVARGWRAWRLPRGRNRGFWHHSTLRVDVIMSMGLLRGRPTQELAAALRAMAPTAPPPGAQPPGQAPHGPVRGTAPGW
ncbi:serine/threonine-protein kinase [Frankia sp. AgKG'84/4]|uniref:serine/threonine-protein kinase n=1 Tax=Frankia sp. AgKG'84/4 TaxID=573490 RepID=UPI00200D8805|nr:serine/threonine-protein kinase [Frankia sp. AgKG'84/4]MCL9796003.1 serine/threonine protein kinase [Frankia sp. AgKG'84/4]